MSGAMYNLAKTPAMPLSDAHFGGFFLKAEPGNLASSLGRLNWLHFRSLLRVENINKPRWVVAGMAPAEIVTNRLVPSFPRRRKSRKSRTA